MPSASCPSAVPPVLSHQTCSAATCWPWPRLPRVTLVINTSSAMPNPLWRTNALPLCSLIGPLTLHSWPGMVTSLQFTLLVRAGAACAALPVVVRAVAARAVTAASDDTMSLMFFIGPLPLVALAGDVVQVVHRVVDEVPGEGLDGEAGPVAAPAGLLPLTAGHASEPAGDGLPGLGQRGGDRGGILLGVALCDRGGVLVPVREQRVVLAENQLQAPVVQPEPAA